MALNFKCPQCVAASLTSQVAFSWPVYTPDAQKMVYCDTDGTLKSFGTGTSCPILYFCTNNHHGYTLTPQGLA